MGARDNSCTHYSLCITAHGLALFKLLCEGWEGLQFTLHIYHYAAEHFGTVLLDRGLALGIDVWYPIFVVIRLAHLCPVFVEFLKALEVVLLICGSIYCCRNDSIIPAPNLYFFH